MSTVSCPLRLTKSDLELAKLTKRDPQKLLDFKNRQVLARGLALANYTPPPPKGATPEDVQLAALTGRDAKKIGAFRRRLAAR